MNQLNIEKLIIAPDPILSNLPLETLMDNDGKYLVEKYNLKPENVAYIGDDLNDLEAMKYVGLSSAPPNSPILDYYNPDFITKRESGSGSFRDLAELIMNAQNINVVF